MIITLDPVIEGGLIGVQLTFSDTDGTAVTPNTITWTLYDYKDTVVNSRSAQSETPAQTVVIVLGGNDLPYLGGAALQLVVTVNFDSATLGSGVNAKIIVKIPVLNAPG